MELGKNLDLNELQKEYNAIFLAIGANITKKNGNKRGRINRSIWRK